MLAGRDHPRTVGHATVGQCGPILDHQHTASDDRVRVGEVEVHALAHITGGGLTENLPRVMPAGNNALIDTGAWERPPVFDWLQQQGKVADAEMYRTFNCGIGMVVCVDSADAGRTIELLGTQGEEACIIGTIEAGDGEPEVILQD